MSVERAGPGPGLRVGQGIDVHRFSDRADRPLVLGGVTISGDGARGLEGHSDADAVAHAIADAVLGAAGLGDLGRHAPDTDPAWRGADSMVILARDGGPGRRRRLGAGERRLHGGGRAAQVWPPTSTGWPSGLGDVLGAPVNVKATRAEGLGALGRAEGIACTAVVLLAAWPAPGADRDAR